ncbi:alpha/beta hydrolase, partial [Ascoidea rubescens DSM 1968]
YLGSFLIMSLSSCLKFVLRTVKIMFQVVGSLAALGLIGIYSFQNKLVYPSFANNGRKHVDTPNKYGMPYLAIDLTTKDNVVIKGFVLRHNPLSANYKDKTIVMLSPNAGNIGHYLPTVKIFFREFHYNVVIVSYRGYGYSEGEPSEKGIKLDAEAILNYLIIDEQFKRSSIILYGRSIGGAVGIYMAYINQVLNTDKNFNISAIILENTFLSIHKVIPFIFPLLKYCSFLCHDKWPSEEYVEHISKEIPVLFLSGLKDEIVPSGHMEELHKLSLSDKKVFIKFKNGYHNDTNCQPDYWKHVYKFIEEDVVNRNL